jgi:hypothetical protein
MPQAEVTMDARKVNERLLAYGLTKHYRNIFQITRLDHAITIYRTLSRRRISNTSASSGGRLPRPSP